MKGCLFPGWPSALELALALSLSGFMTYMNGLPEKEQTEVTSKLQSLQEQLSTLRLKLGLR